MKPSPQCRAALALVARGYYVLVLAERSKIPPEGSHGLHDATCDPKVIERLFTANPRGNLGIACAASRVVCLDVDHHTEEADGAATLAALEAELGKLPETVETMTGTGGRHLYFAAPAGAEFRGALGPGLDIRHNAYCVCPSSVHPDTGSEYRWVRSPLDEMTAELPAAWLARMVKPAAPVATTPAFKPCTTGGSAYGRKARDEELVKVSTWPEGDRNNQLNRSALALGSLHGGGALDDCREDLIAAAMSNPNGKPITEHEARGTVESGWRKGLSEPRTAPPKPDRPAPTTSKTVPASTVAPGQTSASPTETPEEPEDFALDTIEPRPLKWLWFGRLASGEMVVITGAPGVGKGLLLCYVVAHYTTGRSMFGDRIAQPAGNVLWVAVEDAHDTRLVPRLIAAGADRSRVFAWNMNRPLSLPEDADRIVARVDLHHAGIVVIDPAQTVISKDFSANSDADVRRTFAPLMAACRARGCALILVRHTNKRTLGSAMDRGGGSIAWSGMAAIEMMLGRRVVDGEATNVDVNESVVTLATVKNNCGKWARSLNMRIVERGESARLEVLGETDSSADDLVAQDKPRMARKTEDAEALLRRILGDGEWHAQRGIEAEAKAADISHRTLERAKADLGVQSRQRARMWEWCLPRQTAMDPLCGGLAAWRPEDAGGLTSNNSSSLESSDSQDATSPHTPPGGSLTPPDPVAQIEHCLRVRPGTVASDADRAALVGYFRGLNGNANEVAGRLFNYWRATAAPTICEFLAAERKGAPHA